MTLSSSVETLVALLPQPGQPERLYSAMDEATKGLVGHKLFTLLYVDGDEVARVYSNMPGAYPVFGRKLDAEHHYRPGDAEKIMPLAPLLIPAFLEARRPR